MTRREFLEMNSCKILIRQLMSQLSLYYNDRDFDLYHFDGKFREVPLLTHRLNYYVDRYQLLYTKYCSENNNSRRSI